MEEIDQGDKSVYISLSSPQEDFSRKRRFEGGRKSHLTIIKYKL